MKSGGRRAVPLARSFALSVSPSPPPSLPAYILPMFHPSLFPSACLVSSPHSLLLRTKNREEEEWATTEWREQEERGRTRGDPSIGDGGMNKISGDHVVSGPSERSCNVTRPFCLGGFGLVPPSEFCPVTGDAAKRGVGGELHNSIYSMLWREHEAGACVSR